MSNDVRNSRDDPLIDEVRSIREKISETCDHDVDKLVELLRRVEQQHQDRLVKAPPVDTTDANG